MKRKLSIVIAAALIVASLSACGSTGSAGGESGGSADTAMTVISREDGSGTRGAFTELFGIEQKNEDGSKTDLTITTADITNSTGVMLQSVAQNEAAIGYVSLGSLNDTVKALEIDGAAATVENIENGSYKISRPFNIVTSGTLSDVAADFVSYILSADGQAIVADKGYIAVADTGAYAGSAPSGKITVAGSSSVSPVTEKLLEGYKTVNPNCETELQTSDSTTGVSSAIEGVCDIGMASRALKDSETESGAEATVIATDGIAVIVNLANTVTGLTSEQVKGIYTGAVTTWAELG